jgi:NADH:ubiquinone reductase (non-electrogenic)
MQVLVVSPRNHFLFTPLLPSTATGVIDFRSIVEPLRTHEHEVDYYQASVTDIDPVAKKISCEESYRPEMKFDVSYDKLVVAVGAENNTFGIPGVREHAHFLKELSDARKIRQKIIAVRKGVTGASR